VGRLVLINYGEEKGKLAVIVDILDHNRVLVEGSKDSQVKRQVISLRRVTLTKFVVENMPRGARSATAQKYLLASEVEAKFAASAAGQKLAKTAIRRNLTDFDRHKVMLAMTKRSKILKA